MVNDVAGRADFMMPPMATFTVRLDAPLEDGAAVPVTAKASMIYVWFKPPTGEMQDRMQRGIIRRIEASSPEGKDRILDRDIPAMMAARNTLESTHPPVVMATAHSDINVEQKEIP